MEARISPFSERKMSGSGMLDISSWFDDIRRMNKRQVSVHFAKDEFISEARSSYVCNSFILPMGLDSISNACIFNSTCLQEYKLKLNS